MGGAPESIPALGRLKKELAASNAAVHPQILLKQCPEKPLDVHFVFHNFSEGSVYHGGVYHGLLTFPHEYPYKPPSIRFFTANGRFKPGESICTTLSSHHPEEWSPSCTASVLLQATLAHFEEATEHGLGSCRGVSDEQRVELAKLSMESNARNPDFQRLFPQLLAAEVPARPCEPATGSGLSGLSAAAAGDVIEMVDGQVAGSSVLRYSGGEALEEAAVSEELCWICLEGATPQEPLVRLCRCKGTSGGVHRSCLVEFVKRRATGQQQGDPLRCGVCRQSYMGLTVHTKQIELDHGETLCVRIVLFVNLYLSMSAFMMSIFLRFLVESMAVRYTCISVSGVWLLLSSLRIWWMLYQLQSENPKLYIQQVAEVEEDAEVLARAERGELPGAAEICDGTLVEV